MRWHGRLALILFVLLGVVLKLSRGHFMGAQLTALVAAFVAFGAACVACRPSSTDGPSDAKPSRALARVAALFGFLLWASLGLMYRTNHRPDAVISLALGMLLSACLIPALLQLTGKELSRKTGIVVFALAGLSLLTLRVLMLVASPQPLIDVFVTNNLACDYLLAGRNPYAEAYPDLYQGAWPHLPGFFYWPALLYCLAPFRWAFGDVRYATIAADLITAVVLFASARQLRWQPLPAALLALVWLTFPVSLFVLEQAWVDPLLIAGVGCLFLCLLRKQWIAAGILIGLIAGIKQYGGLVGVITLLHLLRHDRGAAVRVAVTAAVTFVVLVVPWVLADPGAFYRSSLGGYAEISPRYDSLSILALLHALGVQVPPTIVAGLGGALALFWCGWCWRGGAGSIGDLRDWAAALACSYGCVFLFGKFAFCNYYYFVAFFVLLFLLTYWSEPGRESPRESAPNR